MLRSDEQLADAPSLVPKTPHGQRSLHVSWLEAGDPGEDIKDHGKLLTELKVKQEGCTISSTSSLDLGLLKMGTVLCLRVPESQRGNFRYHLARSSSKCIPRACIELPGAPLLWTSELFRRVEPCIVHFNTLGQFTLMHIKA